MSVIPVLEAYNTLKSESMAAGSRLLMFILPTILRLLFGWRIAEFGKMAQQVLPVSIHAGPPFRKLGGFKHKEGLRMLQHETDGFTFRKIRIIAINSLQ